MVLLTARETAPRVRAARGWADLTHRELAGRSGVSYDTLRAIEAGDRDLKRAGRAATGDELEAIARACDVPMTFMREGFPRDGADPLEAIRASLTSLTSETARLSAELAEIRDRDRRGLRPVGDR